MRKNAILILLAAVVVAQLAWQQTEIGSLRSEIAKLTPVAPPIRTIHPPAPESYHLTDSPFDNGIGPVRERLNALEEQVGQLNGVAEQLMERGSIPLPEAKVAALKQRFLDASLPDLERLRILRILQRNHTIDDQVFHSGLTWIQTLSDPRLIGDVLEQFIRLQSPALRDTALQLVTMHSDEYVRKRAAQILRGMDGAGVESTIWTALASGQSRDVRHELEGALLNIPVNETRKAELDGRVLNGAATFSERFAAFRVLVSTQAGSAESVASFANEIVARNNVEQIEDLFQTLDNTGNLAAAPALINGLQVDDPKLRALALDALGEMQSDPTVVQWLQHTAKNDVDERLRAEAARVLAQAGNKP